MLEQGDQIAYVPPHASLDGVGHPDVELGFVALRSRYPDYVFCLYFWRHKEDVLRTVRNAELTPVQRLVSLRAYPELIKPEGLIWETLREMGFSQDYPGQQKEELVYLRYAYGVFSWKGRVDELFLLRQVQAERQSQPNDLV